MLCRFSFSTHITIALFVFMSIIGVQFQHLFAFISHHPAVLPVVTCHRTVNQVNPWQSVNKSISCCHGSGVVVVVTVLSLSWQQVASTVIVLRGVRTTI